MASRWVRVSYAVPLILLDSQINPAIEAVNGIAPGKIKAALVHVDDFTRDLIVDILDADENDIFLIGILLGRNMMS
jgi:hypothetical protein